MSANSVLEKLNGCGLPEQRAYHNGHEGLHMVDGILATLNTSFQRKDLEGYFHFVDALVKRLEWSRRTRPRTQPCIGSSGQGIAEAPETSTLCGRNSWPGSRQIPPALGSVYRWNDSTTNKCGKNDVGEATGTPLPLLMLMNGVDRVRSTENISRITRPIERKCV